jgi:hypothetical protein
MDQEQTQTVLTTLTRIDTRQEAIKEMLDRHEKQVGHLTTRVDVHENKFHRMKGGITVLSLLFTVIAAISSLQFWK